MYVVEVTQYYQFGEYENEQINVTIGLFEDLNDAKIASKGFLKETFGVDEEFQHFDLIERIQFVYYSKELHEDITVVLDIVERPLYTFFDTSTLFT